MVTSRFEVVRRFSRDVDHSIQSFRIKYYRRDMKSLRVVVRAFHACLVRVSGDSAEEEAGGLRVDGSAVFNAVVRLCVTSLYPYLKNMMKLPNTSVTKKHVEKSKKWPYAKNVLRSYLIDLFKVIITRSENSSTWVCSRLADGKSNVFRCSYWIMSLPKTFNEYCWNIYTKWFRSSPAYLRFRRLSWNKSSRSGVRITTIRCVWYRSCVCCVTPLPTRTCTCIRCWKYDRSNNWINIIVSPGD